MDFLWNSQNDDPFISFVNFLKGMLCNCKNMTFRTYVKSRLSLLWNFINYALVIQNLIFRSSTESPLKTGQVVFKSVSLLKISKKSFLFFRWRFKRNYSTKKKETLVVETLETSSTGGYFPRYLKCSLKEDPLKTLFRYFEKDRLLK